MGHSLLIVVNDANFFLSHRLAVAEGARRAGYVVIVATMPGPGVERICELGFTHYSLPLSRSGVNIAREFYAWLSIWRLLWTLKPEILHLVTIKPVLYGGIAARLAPVGGVVAAISGLGSIFTSIDIRSKILKILVRVMYRFAFGKNNTRVIFQNPDDRNKLLNCGAVRLSKTELIPGSGVDLTLYSAKPEPLGTPVVCFAARLLKDKGVVEFVEAAKLLHSRGVVARFLLVGDIDLNNPGSVTPDMIERWKEEDHVELLGYRENISDIFSNSHVITLPSYYGEGLPKVLIEAAACGRAVVTTDHPGCRDAIEADVTGLLVPIKDSGALADAIEWLISNPENRKQFGEAGRRLAERAFDVEKVVDAHIRIYQQLVKN